MIREILGGIPRSAVSEYDTSMLDDREVAVLYYALREVLVMVRDNEFMLVTLAEKETKGDFIIPSFVASKSVDSINEYLREKRFYFYRLQAVEDYNCFIGKVTTMKPYPSIEGYHVYRLTDVSDFYNKVKLASVRNELKITYTDGSEFVFNNLYKESVRGTCASGKFFGYNKNGEFVSTSIFNIKSVDAISDNKTVQKLLSGVCKYKDMNITLNRDILEKFYGYKKLYTKLESLNVRKRYCYEELIASRGSTQDYIASKYGLPVKYYGFDTREELMRLLKDELSKEKPSKGIRARVLTNNLEHRSFYVTIPDNAELEVIEDVVSVMPKTFYYYAINDSWGFRGVEVRATSQRLAKQYGKTEFERCFGYNNEFVKVTETPIKIKDFTTDCQRDICQNIMYGYTQNYKGYSPLIKSLFANNGISVTDTDIQFLFVNNLAKKFKVSGNVTLIEVVKNLLNFMDICVNQQKHDKMLCDVLFSACIGKVRKIAKDLEDNGFADYEVSDGKIEKSLGGTDSVTFHLTKDNHISAYADIVYKSVDLGRKKIVDK